jgi:hypothetical protein
LFPFLASIIAAAEVRDVKEAFEKAIWDMEGTKKDLKKLMEYVDPEVTIDEIVHRLLDAIQMLDSTIQRSWSVIGESLPPLSEYWDWDDEHACRDEFLSEVEWADEEDVDWDEIADRRMN